MRARILDCPVDILTREETVERALHAMRTRTPTQHVALNVAKLVSARTSPTLARDVAQADIIGIDGMGVALALRLTGARAAPRVAGADLFVWLMEACAREGFRPYLLGATQEVLDTAIANLKARFPALVIAGAHHGYFNGRDREIVEKVKAARPDCLFVAMPTPRKEDFMAQWREEMGVPFVMGVGGTFDVVAGKVARAPQWVQNAGLEWAYRLAQEPRRMWRRYLTTNAVFALLLAREVLLPAKRPRTGEAL